MGRVLPILFNTDMVLAILDGRKTVTRRVVKKSQCMLADRKEPHELDSKYAPYDGMTDAELVACTYRPPCKPGDVWYVRETWNFVYGMDDSDQIIEDTGYYVYRADDPMPFSHWVDSNTGEHKDYMPWRPSIHMPKQAARIWLRVTDVRVERLQDMSTDDFLAEGVIIRPEAFNDPENAYQQAKEEFIHIWDSTISKEKKDLYGWGANHWVWVIEFERCEKQMEG